MTEGKNLFVPKSEAIRNLDEKEVLVIDSGDKSAESLHAEASAAEPGHALSNETPSKQDALREIAEKKDKGEISILDSQKRVAAVEQATAEPVLTGKLPIERFVEPATTKVVEVVNPTRSHQVSSSAILKPENKTEYDRLLKDVEDAKGDRQLGDIPLNDPYWAKQNAITVFLSNLKS